MAQLKSGSTVGGKQISTVDHTHTPESIGAEVAGAAAAVQSYLQGNLDQHALSSIHITEAERAAWNGKENAGTAASLVNEHNTDGGAHQDIRTLVQQGAKVVLGSYIGTGATDVTINFPFVPEFIIVGPYRQSNVNQTDGFNPLQQSTVGTSAPSYIIPYGVPLAYFGGSGYKIVWSGASVTINFDKFNTTNAKYYYIAFC